MMRFEPSLSNPLLQVAVGVSEATIRQACQGSRDLHVTAGLSQYPDGRDSICVTLRTSRGVGCFEMLLRNYFDRQILFRVARRTWMKLLAGQDKTEARIEQVGWWEKGIQVGGRN